MRQRWTLFLAALAGTGVLAAGVVVVADRVFTAAAPAPRLGTVPTSVLVRAGYTLSAASTPPYCGMQQAAAGRGWLPQGAAGCPMSQSAAEEPAAGAVQEALLARVTSSANGIGRDRLMWLVVYRPARVLQPMIRCASPASGPPCPPAPAPTSQRAVLFVDAYTARVMAIVPVSGGGAVPIQPLPAPTYRGGNGKIIPVPFPVTPIPAPSPVETQAPLRT
jgi:hypothetical protein